MKKLMTIVITAILVSMSGCSSMVKAGYVNIGGGVWDYQPGDVGYSYTFRITNEGKIVSDDGRVLTKVKGQYVDSFGTHYIQKPHDVAYGDNGTVCTEPEESVIWCRKLASD